MDSRQNEADADDYSRMAWLSIHLGESERVKQYIARGLKLDPQNQHCLALASKRFGKGAVSSSKR
jgi:hypothetical protein